MRIPNPPGLRMDDLIMEEYAGVAEALKRISPQERYDREFRLKVALDLSAKHQYLPKNLWTTDETVWLGCCWCSLFCVFFQERRGCAWPRARVCVCVCVRGRVCKVQEPLDYR